MMTLTDAAIGTIPLPDTVYRLTIRHLLSKRLAEELVRYQSTSLADYAADLRKQPITVLPDKANDQHYEVPVLFYQHVMGRHKKYSCCWFKSPSDTLSDAEQNMLTLTCHRADIQNGQRILELGCGWGSLSLYMAQKFRQSAIVAVSNSRSQRDYIEGQAEKLGLRNLKVLTQNVADLELNVQFDRVVSVEMLEHIRNYEQMFEKIASWLTDSGRFFAHIFGHRQLAYPFDDTQSPSWMARHFFSGGQMPGRALFAEFNRHLRIEKDWTVSGLQYAKTCRAWLTNMDANKSKILPIFRSVYGPDAKKFWIYWRLFFMACEELFAYNQGKEWQVYHYLFKKC